MGERGKKVGQTVKENFEFSANCIQTWHHFWGEKNSRGGCFSEILYQWY